ncbi:hypothetical protein [Streptomyces sp. NPDC055243]|uniref:hypothetical protein n=1 Tax=Streptomyces sp. NPDC055243 TaxID=3365720 RepID=UPI0037D88F55
MSEYPEIAERFARETARHEMVVLQDHGLYRRLVFRPQGHSFYWFELITTPGQLVFSGDGESYVFRRLDDMFEFFRSGLRRDGSVRIDPGYWDEKLASNRDAARTYSQKRFDEEVARDLEIAEESYPGVTAAWAEHLEDEFNTEYEEEARRALDEFSFGESYKATCKACDWSTERSSWWSTHSELTNHRNDAGAEHNGPVRDQTFHFTDTWEWQLRDHDWWFLWACTAIVSGIARYDKLRKYGLLNTARSTKAVA